MNNIPKHIAIIPDGNRRWAKMRGLPTFEGHRAAAEKTLPSLIEKAAQLGVKYFTFWALSSENISKRTKQEIKHLLYLIRYAINKQINEFKKKDVRLQVIGDLDKLPQDIQEGIIKAVNETKDNKRIVLILGINYGGRDEIIRAIKKIYNSEFTIQNLTKDNFGEFLDTENIPDPDLIIRTGGEKRLSGFMLWQSEYSELYFSDLYFPDFSQKKLEEAIQDYSLRQRRFGK